ncbi:immunity 52 family protein [Achromobacter aloeverae]
MLNISAFFHDDTLLSKDFGRTLIRMGSVIDAIAACTGRFDRNYWCLKGRSDQDARLYPAFENNGPSTAVLAILKEKYRKIFDRTHVGLWDGSDDDGSGIGMTCHVGPQGERRWLDIITEGVPELREVRVVQAIVLAIAREFTPAVVTVSPLGYTSKQVFQDKPGAGWMLYLPTILSARDVPEARALLAVPEAGKKQIGTILVSVADAEFSVDNPNHVEVANRIEIRLVDQDLLPRYIDI